MLLLGSAISPDLSVPAWGPDPHPLLSPRAAQTPAPRE